MDVYKVGVVLALKNGISSGLRVIQGDLGRFMGAVDRANHQVGNLGKSLLIAGTASATAGAAILGLWEKIIAKGDEMQKQIAAMHAMGVRTANIGKNEGAAFGASTSLFNVSPQHAAETLNQLRSILGNSKEAREALTPILKAEVGLNSVLGGKTGNGLIQALKALDITGSLIKGGHMSVSALLKNLPYIEQAMILTHGQLSGAEIKRMIQQAGPAATATSFRKLLMDMTEATMALGPAVGRGLFTSYMVAYAGRANALSARTLVQDGLIPAKDVTHVKGSFYRLLNTDHLYGEKYLKKHGFLDWIHTKIIPKLVSEGYKTPQALMQQLSRIFPASTSARLIAWVIHNWPQVMRFHHLMDRAVTHGHPYQAAQTTWSGAVSNFAKAWSGLMTALGLPQVKSAAAALNSISDGIHHLTLWMSRHPRVAGEIDKTLLAIASALGVLGATLMAAGIVALIGPTGTLAAIGAAFAAFGAVLAGFHWKTLGDAVDAAIHKVGAAIQWLLHPLQNAMNYLFGPTHPSASSGNVGLSQTLNPFAHPGAPPPAPHHAHDHPVPVHVTNSGDIHNGTARAVAHHLSGRQHGPTGLNPSYTAIMPAGAY